MFLSVLKMQIFTKIGATKPTQVSMRLAATNRNLKQETAEGHFRPDLHYIYYVPPLSA